jgi:hypothetical protein
MPIVALQLQKQFKLTIAEGLPQANVEMVGQVFWLRCCPLCGCTHQILGLDKSVPYEPLCQTFPLIYKTQLVAWHKLYPDVAKYTKLNLSVRKGK